MHRISTKLGRREPWSAVAAFVAMSLIPGSAWAGAPPVETPEDVGDAAPGETEAAPEEAEATSPAERAKNAFVEGNTLYAEARYTEAARAYESSFEAVPTGSSAYNAARSHDKANHPLLALEWYESYLDLLGPEGVQAPENTEFVTNARARIEQLKPEIGRIELVLEPGVSLSTIELDGELRTADQFPMRVLPGPHKIVTVDQSEHRTVEVVDLLPGELARVRVAPAPEPEPEPVAPLPEVIDEPEAPTGPAPLEPAYVTRIQRVRMAGWTSLGLAGASGIAWAVLGALTIQAKNERDASLCPQDPRCDDPSSDYMRDLSLEDTFYRRRTATNAMVGVTAGLGVTAATLLIVGHTGKAKRVPRRRPGRRSATVSATAGGLRLEF